MNDTPFFLPTIDGCVQSGCVLGTSLTLKIVDVPIPDCGPFGCSWGAWYRSQFGQAELTRWKKWCDVYTYLRRQTLAQHIFSVSCYAGEIISRTNEVLVSDGESDLDRAIMLDGFRVHDVGEQLLRQDVAGPLKRDEHDLMEYLAFRWLFGRLGKPEWPVLQRAFLLQTCMKNSNVFPEEERKIMSKLQLTHWREALLFRAIELGDYRNTAFEGLRDGCQEMLGRVVAHHISEQRRLEMQLPAIAKAMWPSGMLEFCLAEAEKFKDSNGFPNDPQLELELPLPSAA